MKKSLQKVTSKISKKHIIQGSVVASAAIGGGIAIGMVLADSDSYYIQNLLASNNDKQAKILAYSGGQLKSAIASDVKFAANERLIKIEHEDFLGEEKILYIYGVPKSSGPHVHANNSQTVTTSSTSANLTEEQKKQQKANEAIDPTPGSTDESLNKYLGIKLANYNITKIFKFGLETNKLLSFEDKGAQADSKTITTINNDMKAAKTSIHDLLAEVTDFIKMLDIIEKCDSTTFKKDKFKLLNIDIKDQDVTSALSQIGFGELVDFVDLKKLHVSIEKKLNSESAHIKLEFTDGATPQIFNYDITFTKFNVAPAHIRIIDAEQLIINNYLKGLPPQNLVHNATSMPGVKKDPNDPDLSHGIVIDPSKLQEFKDKYGIDLSGYHFNPRREVKYYLDLYNSSAPNPVDGIEWDGKMQYKITVGWNMNGKMDYADKYPQAKNTPAENEINVTGITQTRVDIAQDAIAKQSVTAEYQIDAVDFAGIKDEPLTPTIISKYGIKGLKLDPLYTYTITIDPQTADNKTANFTIHAARGGIKAAMPSTFSTLNIKGLSLAQEKAEFDAEIKRVKAAFATIPSWYQYLNSLPAATNKDITALLKEMLGIDPIQGYSYFVDYSAATGNKKLHLDVYIKKASEFDYVKLGGTAIKVSWDASLAAKNEIEGSSAISASGMVELFGIDEMKALNAEQVKINAAIAAAKKLAMTFTINEIPAADGKLLTAEELKFWGIAPGLQNAGAIVLDPKYVYKISYGRYVDDKDKTQGIDMVNPIKKDGASGMKIEVFLKGNNGAEVPAITPSKMGEINISGVEGGLYSQLEQQRINKFAADSFTQGNPPTQYISELELQSRDLIHPSAAHEFPPGSTSELTQGPGPDHFAQELLKYGIKLPINVNPHDTDPSAEDYKNFAARLQYTYSVKTPTGSFTDKITADGMVEIVVRVWIGSTANAVAEQKFYVNVTGINETKAIKAEQVRINALGNINARISELSLAALTDEPLTEALAKKLGIFNEFSTKLSQFNYKISMGAVNADGTYSISVKVDSKDPQNNFPEPVGTFNLVIDGIDEAKALLAEQKRVQGLTGLSIYKYVTSIQPTTTDVDLDSHNCTDYGIDASKLDFNKYIYKLSIPTAMTANGDLKIIITVSAKDRSTNFETQVNINKGLLVAVKGINAAIEQEKVLVKAKESKTTTSPFTWQVDEAKVKEINKILTPASNEMEKLSYIDEAHAQVLTDDFATAMNLGIVLDHANFDYYFYTTPFHGTASELITDGKIDVFVKVLPKGLANASGVGPAYSEFNIKVSGILAIIARREVRVEQGVINALADKTASTAIQTTIDAASYAGVSTQAPLTAALIAELNLGITMKPGFIYNYTLVPANPDGSGAVGVDGEAVIKVFVSKNTTPAISSISSFNVKINGIDKHNMQAAVNAEQRVIDALSGAGWAINELEFAARADHVLATAQDFAAIGITYTPKPGYVYKLTHAKFSADGTYQVTIAVSHELAAKPGYRPSLETLVSTNAARTIPVVVTGINKVIALKAEQERINAITVSNPVQLADADISSAGKFEKITDQPFTDAINAKYGLGIVMKKFFTYTYSTDKALGGNGAVKFTIKVTDKSAPTTKQTVAPQGISVTLQGIEEVAQRKQLEAEQTRLNAAATASQTAPHKYIVTTTAIASVPANTPLDQTIASDLLGITLDLTLYTYTYSYAGINANGDLIVTVKAHRKYKVTGTKNGTDIPETVTATTFKVAAVGVNRAIEKAEQARINAFFGTTAHPKPTSKWSPSIYSSGTTLHTAKANVAIPAISTWTQLTSTILAKYGMSSLVLDTGQFTYEYQVIQLSGADGDFTLKIRVTSVASTDSGAAAQTTPTDITFAVTGINEMTAEWELATEQTRINALTELHATGTGTALLLTSYPAETEVTIYDGTAPVAAMIAKYHLDSAGIAFKAGYVYKISTVQMARDGAYQFKISVEKAGVTARVTATGVTYTAVGIDAAILFDRLKIALLGIDGNTYSVARNGKTLTEAQIAEVEFAKGATTNTELTQDLAREFDLEPLIRPQFNGADIEYYVEGWDGTGNIPTDQSKYHIVDKDHSLPPGETKLIAQSFLDLYRRTHPNAKFFFSVAAKTGGGDLLADGELTFTLHMVDNAGQVEVAVATINVTGIDATKATLELMAEQARVNALTGLVGTTNDVSLPAIAAGTPLTAAIIAQYGLGGASGIDLANTEHYTYTIEVAEITADGNVQLKIVVSKAGVAKIINWTDLAGTAQKIEVPAATALSAAISGIDAAKLLVEINDLLDGITGTQKVVTLTEIAEVTAASDTTLSAALAASLGISIPATLNGAIITYSHPLINADGNLDVTVNVTKSGTTSYTGSQTVTKHLTIAVSGLDLANANEAIQAAKTMIDGFADTTRTTAAGVVEVPEVTAASDTTFDLAVAQLMGLTPAQFNALAALGDTMTYSHDRWNADGTYTITITINKSVHGTAGVETTASFDVAVTGLTEANANAAIAAGIAAFAKTATATTTNLEWLALAKTALTPALITKFGLTVPSAASALELSVSHGAINKDGDLTITISVDTPHSSGPQTFDIVVSVTGFNKANASRKISLVHDDIDKLGDAANSDRITAPKTSDREWAAIASLVTLNPKDPADVAALAKLGITLPASVNAAGIVIKYKHGSITSDGDLIVTFEVSTPGEPASTPQTFTAKIAVTGMDEADADADIKTIGDSFPATLDHVVIHDVTTANIDEIAAAAAGSSLDAAAAAALGITLPPDLLGTTLTYTHQMITSDGDLSVVITITKSPGTSVDKTIVISLKGLTAADNNDFINHVVAGDLNLPTPVNTKVTDDEAQPGNGTTTSGVAYEYTKWDQNPDGTIDWEVKLTKGSGDTEGIERKLTGQLTGYKTLATLQGALKAAMDALDPSEATTAAAIADAATHAKYVAITSAITTGKAAVDNATTIAGANSASTTNLALIKAAITAYQAQLKTWGGAQADATVAGTKSTVFHVASLDSKYTDFTDAIATLKTALAATTTPAEFDTAYAREIQNVLDAKKAYIDALRVIALAKLASLAVTKDGGVQATADTEWGALNTMQTAYKTQVTDATDGAGMDVDLTALAGATDTYKKKVAAEIVKYLATQAATLDSNPLAKDTTKRADESALANTAYTAYTGGYTAYRQGLINTLTGTTFTSFADVDAAVTQAKADLIDPSKFALQKAYEDLRDLAHKAYDAFDWLKDVSHVDMMIFYGYYSTGTYSATTTDAILTTAPYANADAATHLATLLAMLKTGTLQIDFTKSYEGTMVFNFEAIGDLSYLGASAEAVQSAVTTLREWAKAPTVPGIGDSTTYADAFSAWKTATSLTTLPAETHTQDSADIAAVTAADLNLPSGAKTPPYKPVDGTTTSGVNYKYTKWEIHVDGSVDWEAELKEVGGIPRLLTGSIAAGVCQSLADYKVDRIAEYTAIVTNISESTVDADAKDTLYAALTTALTTGTDAVNNAATYDAAKSAFEANLVLINAKADAYLAALKTWGEAQIAALNYIASVKYADSTTPGLYSAFTDALAAAKVAINAASVTSTAEFDKVYTAEMAKIDTADKAYKAPVKAMIVALLTARTAKLVGAASSDEETTYNAMDTAYQAIMTTVNGSDVVADWEAIDTTPFTDARAAYMAQLEVDAKARYEDQRFAESTEITNADLTAKYSAFTTALDAAKSAMESKTAPGEIDAAVTTQDPLVAAALKAYLDALHAEAVTIFITKNGNVRNTGDAAWATLLAVQNAYKAKIDAAMTGSAVDALVGSDKPGVLTAISTYNAAIQKLLHDYATAKNNSLTSPTGESSDHAKNANTHALYEAYVAGYRTEKASYQRAILGKASYDEMDAAATSFNNHITSKTGYGPLKAYWDKHQADVALVNNMNTFVRERNYMPLIGHNSGTFGASHSNRILRNGGNSTTFNKIMDALRAGHFTMATRVDGAWIRSQVSWKGQYNYLSNPGRKDTSFKDTLAAWFNHRNMSGIDGSSFGYALSYWMEADSHRRWFAGYCNPTPKGFGSNHWFGMSAYGGRYHRTKGYDPANAGHPVDRHWGPGFTNGGQVRMDTNGGSKPCGTWRNNFARVMTATSGWDGIIEATGPTRMTYVTQIRLFD